MKGEFHGRGVNASACVSFCSSIPTLGPRAHPFIFLREMLLRNVPGWTNKRTHRWTQVTYCLDNSQCVKGGEIQWLERSRNVDLSFLFDIVALTTCNASSKHYSMDALDDSTAVIKLLTVFINPSVLKGLKYNGWKDRGTLIFPSFLP